jgi:8-oxo-dGTP pyrophosphatase MutT (NUDIX family)
MIIHIRSCVYTARLSNDANEQLMIAARNGAARELFEETGIDIRSNVARLLPAQLRAEPEVKGGRTLLINEYKHRLFFSIRVTDADFLERGEPPIGTEGKHLSVS